jgi:hypothetical protein
MDRISALRNVEAALRAFEDGECSFETLEGRVEGVLRTYVSSFEGDGVAPYRVVDGPPATEGMVVVASDAVEARERVRALGGDGNGASRDGVEGAIDVERVATEE